MDPLTAAGALVTVTAAAGVLYRAARPVRHSFGRFSEFLDGWFGEPERLGRPATPSVPARLLKLEERASNTEHYVRGELAGSLVLLREGVDSIGRAATANQDALARLDERVTDHRRRNESQVDLLRVELERRLEAASAERTALGDRAALAVLAASAAASARRQTDPTPEPDLDPKD